MSTRTTKYELEQQRLSKRIAKGVLIFWGVYRIVTLCVSLWRPEIIQGLTALTTGVDDLASVVVISYLVHSGSENIVGKYFSSKQGERGKLFDFTNKDADSDEEELNG